MKKRTLRNRFLVLVAILVGSASVARAQSDSANAVATVAAFHAALQAGDSVKALSLLADDVRIAEAGGLEDKQKFRNGHLAGDINFAKAVKSERTLVGVVVLGSAAWVTSSSTTTGETNGRQVNSQGAETMVLTKERDGWKIRAIHWSSRARRP